MPSRYTPRQYRQRKLADAAKMRAVRLMVIALPKIVPLFTRDERLVRKFRGRTGQARSLMNRCNASDISVSETLDETERLLDGQDRESLQATIAPMRLEMRESDELKQIAVDSGKDWTKAVDSFAAYVSTHPESYLAHTYLAGALKNLGRLQDSLAVYREAIVLVGHKSNQGLSVRIKMGLIMYEQGDREDAITEFQKVIEDATAGSEIWISLAYLSLGNALIGVGKRREGRSALKQAIKWDSTGVFSAKARILLAKRR